ncbi:MAG: pentapeptide repeat-containing protein [Defluviitaleaceae bacterium]|nr:pentapeptide repeat-containing protein [Defluviitaleaceae bacterium]
MKKTHTRNKFYKKAAILGMKQVAPLETYLDEHEGELVGKFVRCFETYCQKIINMQEKGKKDALSYLHFSLLRTNILAKHYVFRIDAYNKDWYLDEQACVGEYDVSDLFSFMNGYEKDLEKERHISPYAPHISAADVKSLLLEESSKYTDIIIELIRLALKEAVKTMAYQAVLREDLFVIQVGEFRDVNYTVYVEDRRPKQPKDVIKLLERTDEEHQYEMFEQVELQGGHFNELRMAYSSGKGSQFIKSQFQRALMIACDFQGATFHQVSFKNAQLLELDFTGARMEEVDFEGAELHYLNFENATLVNIDFSKAVTFEGINLTNATLINTTIPSESEVS